MGERVIWYLNQLDAVHGSNGWCFRFFIFFAIVDRFDAVGAECLHARGAGHGGAGDNAGFSPFEEAAKVDFGVQHVLLAILARCPESLRRGEAWEKAVVGGADDPIVLIQGCGTDFAVGILGSQGCHVCKCHNVLGDGESAHGASISQLISMARSICARPESRNLL